MKYPTVSSYLDSLASGLEIFRTLSVDDFARDVSGRPAIICGNNAVVFIVMIDGRKHQLKCFLRPGGCRREVYACLSSSDNALTAPVRLLPEEMYAWDSQGRGAYYDVVVAGWIEGVTLAAKVRDAAFCGDKTELESLARKFDSAMVLLLGEDWAHGDIKPENIIVTPGGNLRLVDYDAMFVPRLTGAMASELGTPGWQHPARGATMYDKHIDDYSIALLSITLHAIALDPSLYLGAAPYDCRIIEPVDIAGGNMPERIVKLFADSGYEKGTKLCAALLSDSPAIEGLAGMLS